MLYELNPSLIDVEEDDFLFRAEKLWRLLEILQNKELQLSSTADWGGRFSCPDLYEDPLHQFRYIENLTSDGVKVAVMDDQDTRPQINVDGLCRMRALCFGSDPEKVLSVHRAKPTNFDDIRIVVKISVRKLLATVRNDPREYISSEVTIGKVIYVSNDNEIMDDACRFLEAVMNGGFMLVESHKRTFFLKRKKYHVEDEKRLIVLIPSECGNDQVVRIKIDPLELIEEIVVDRMVDSTTENNIRNRLRQTGYPEDKIVLLK